MYFFIWWIQGLGNQVNVSDDCFIHKDFFLAVLNLLCDTVNINIRLLSFIHMYIKVQQYSYFEDIKFSA